MKVLDMHCDTITRLYRRVSKWIFIRKYWTYRFKENAKRWLSSSKLCDVYQSRKYIEAFLKVNQYINYYYQEIEKYPDLIQPGLLLSRYSWS